MTNCHLMETQNLVISFDYSWFLAKNLAYAECLIMKFHYRNSSIQQVCESQKFKSAHKLEIFSRINKDIRLLIRKNRALNVHGTQFRSYCCKNQMMSNFLNKNVSQRATILLKIINQGSFLKKAYSATLSTQICHVKVR